MKDIRHQKIRKYEEEMSCIVKYNDTWRVPMYTINYTMSELHRINIILQRIAQARKDKTFNQSETTTHLSEELAHIQKKIKEELEQDKLEHTLTGQEKRLLVSLLSNITIELDMRAEIEVEREI